MKYLLGYFFLFQLKLFTSHFAAQEQQQNIHTNCQGMFKLEDFQSLVMKSETTYCY